MPSFELLLDFYKSYFYYPYITGTLIAIGIILAIVFGIGWLACYNPPYSNIIKKHWLWIALIISPFFTLAAITFIQIPLQSLVEPDTLAMILLTALPSVIIGGLVQEGAKMVPAVAYWWSNKRKISVKTGLLIGAVAGTGFGILESQWVINLTFTQGWSWDLIQSFGPFHAISPFWERFFVTAFHISACALTGYGLAKGKGWQFYLIVSLLHAVLNYIAIIIAAQVITFIQAEILIAIWAIAVTSAALWIRWKKI